MPGGEPPTPAHRRSPHHRRHRASPCCNLNDPTLNLVPQAWSPDGARGWRSMGWDDSDPTRTGIYTGNGPRRDRRRFVVTSTGGAPHDIAARLLARRDEARLLSCGSRRAGLPDRYRWAPSGSLMWMGPMRGSSTPRRRTGGLGGRRTGRTILFVSERNQPAGAICTIRPDGSGLTTALRGPRRRLPHRPDLVPRRHVRSCSSSTRSATGSPTPNNVLCVMRSDGTGLTKLIDTPDLQELPGVVVTITIDPPPTSSNTATTSRSCGSYCPMPAIDLIYLDPGSTRTAITESSLWRTKDVVSL